MKKDLTTTTKDLATTDFKKLSKKELVKIAEDFIMPFSNPTKYKQLVESQFPELVKKMDDHETRATSVMQMSQEMLLACVETLKLFHGFTETQLKKFITDLTGNLTVVKEIEEGGLSILSEHSMQTVVQMVKEVGVDKMLQKIAEIRYQKERTWKSGLEHPRVLEGSSVERRIQKP
jgi:hypothetical protein